MEDWSDLGLSEGVDFVEVVDAVVVVGGVVVVVFFPFFSTIFPVDNSSPVPCLARVKVSITNPRGEPEYDGSFDSCGDSTFGV